MPKSHKHKVLLWYYNCDITDYLRQLLWTSTAVECENVSSDEYHMQVNLCSSFIYLCSKNVVFQIINESIPWTTKDGQWEMSDKDRVHWQIRWAEES